jgi:hypothetical protein
MDELSQDPPDQIAHEPILLGACRQSLAPAGSASEGTTIATCGVLWQNSCADLKARTQDSFHSIGPASHRLFPHELCGFHPCITDRIGREGQVVHPSRNCMSVKTKASRCIVVSPKRPRNKPATSPCPSPPRYCRRIRKTSADNKSKGVGAPRKCQTKEKAARRPPLPPKAQEMDGLPHAVQRTPCGRVAS